jgi:hypothetical protein
VQVSNKIWAYWYQYFTENPDCNNSAYNSKYGVYSEGCGLDRVFMSWGHDDYMYLVLISDLVFLVTIKILFYLLIKKIKKKGTILFFLIVMHRRLKIQTKISLKLQESNFHSGIDHYR